MREVSGEISIDDNFTTMISTLEGAITKVEGGIGKNEYFEHTNLIPFTSDLEILIRLLICLDRYKVFFEEDIRRLDRIGKSLHEEDERLANSMCVAND